MCVHLFFTFPSETARKRLPGNAYSIYGNFDLRGLKSFKSNSASDNDIFTYYTMQSNLFLPWDFLSFYCFLSQKL